MGPAVLGDADRLNSCHIWGESMKKYKCKICGYIYDPEKGDPDGDVPADTPFEKLPDSWVCPVCGAPKDMFEEA